MTDGAPLLWVEELDRHGRCRQRWRMDRLPARIGWDYRHDVVPLEPAEAPLPRGHLEVTAAAGGLQVQACDGLAATLDGRPLGLAPVPCPPSALLNTVGATMRLVDARRAGAAPSRAPRAARAAARPVAITVALGVAAVAAHAWAQHWLTLRAQSAGQTLLDAASLPFWALAWALAWAGVARLVGGTALPHDRLHDHLRLACAGLLAWGLGRVVLPLAAALLGLAVPDGTGSALLLLLATAVVAGHLQRVGLHAPLRARVRHATVALGVLAVALQVVPPWLDDESGPELAAFAPPLAAAWRARPRAEVLKAVADDETRVAAERQRPLPRALR